jgi:hypothetical protein
MTESVNFTNFTIGTMAMTVSSHVSACPRPASLKTNVAPLTNALDSVLAMRGVRYRGKPVTAPTAAADGDAQQIGFVGQEVAAACPAATPGGKP